MRVPNRRGRKGLTSLLVASSLLQPGSGAEARSWSEVIDTPVLHAEERAGARFLQGHLDFESYEALSPGHRNMLLRYAADHRRGNPRLTICWRDNTPAEVIHAFMAVEQAGLEVRNENRRPIGIGTAFQIDLADHWARTATNGSGQGAQGQQVTLTWSFVPDGTLIPGGEVNGEATNDPSNLRAWLAGLYGGSATDPADQQPWFPIFQAVFDSISAQSGVRYVYEPVDDGATLSSASSGQGVLGVRGDVRISGHALDGNSNVLAYNYFPDYSDMVIDTDDNFYDDLSNDSLRLRNVVEHEHGHGLGLQHVCPLDHTKLMEPFVNLNFTGVQFDDIYSLQRLYGDTLEIHGSERDNDTLVKATPVSTPVNVPYVKQWIGIDDDTDTDCFRFSSPAGAQLTVRVIPSTASYLEGEQNLMTGNCTAGTPFDSSLLHDLSFEIIGSDQTTVLATSNTEPAGVAEMVTDLPITTAGDYYVRVQGGVSDYNQLYRLEIEVNTPSVAIQLASSTLSQELFQGANGAPDPGETVALDIGLTNAGLVDASNLQAEMVLPPGSLGFELIKNYGDLANSGGSDTRTFVFAPAGSCGEEIELLLQLTDDNGYAATLPVAITLGAEQVLLGENFDASPSLPASWTSAETGMGSQWSVVASASHSAPNAVFAADVNKSGSSTLTSPVMVAGETPGTLSFHHLYDTEASWDGGVLEMQIGAGPWQDVVDAGGSFASGGYVLALNSSGSNNPLAGRSSWSGLSNGFIETVVELPPSAANQDIRFRWIIGHDQRVGGNGWFIDDVVYRNTTCDESGVALTLSSDDSTTTETSDSSDTAEVRVSAVLPVPGTMPVSLQATGSADPMSDITGFGNLVLMTGEASVAATLDAVSDGQIEGVETLHVTSTEASGSVDVTINDSAYATWALAGMGNSGLLLPDEDFDGDGSSNVEELVNGADPADPASKPVVQLVPDGGDFAVFVPLGLLPEGVSVDAEGSGDLQSWTPAMVTRLDDRFVLSGAEAKAFLRLIYSVPEFD